MKKLIENIAENNHLMSLELNDGKLNPILLYFDDKDDFYIILSSEYQNLLHQIELEENSNDIDLGINAYLDTIKEYSDTEIFRSRFIDFNLSCIVAVQLETLENENILKQIHKIEEDYKIAKKYVLPYLNSDFELLNEKLQSIASDSLNEKLNKIALENSDIINNKDESWYQLLMNLFIKLPFLNYHSDSFGLTTVAELLDTDLSGEEKTLQQNINDNYSESVDIETFISQFQIADDEQI
ncbi:ABC-three component system middle component 1 [Chryseobacterium indologenes]|uniref:ABC-three component system middle component 1 n=1 Tax=Chryseobacterium indologenes TaxID=253 RepID=UPI00191725D7|nr:ABC-three component system middle component 1 [Chryseobacterium indologenes]QQQ70352.1 hypothetical protein JHW31_17895 [Chryseobacterium indologenes]